MEGTGFWGLCLGLRVRDPGLRLRHTQHSAEKPGGGRNVGTWAILEILLVCPKHSDPHEERGATRDHALDDCQHVPWLDREL